MKLTTITITNPTSHILLLTLNRPDVRNAIHFQMMEDLVQVWHELMNPKDIRCVILTGEGKAFCAGADLKARQNMDIDTWRKQHLVLEKAMLTMLQCPIPVIAAVNGAAFGGGLELVLACDFAYTAEHATFSQSEVKVGLMPGAMGTQHLPRAAGIRRANELTFTGDIFSAEEAYRYGIVNKVCPANQLMNEVLITANKICENAPLAIRQAKQALIMSQQLDIKTGYQFEIDVYNTLLTSKDKEEGIAAFNQKRKPQFTGH